MLLNQGTESLVTATRRWARDPSTAANPMFDTDADVIPSINEVYLELCDELRFPDTGWAKKRTYLDGQATTTPEDHFYPLPDDFLGRLRVEISTNGSDLSTTLPSSTASIKTLKLAGYDTALDHYNIDSGGTSDVKYFFMFGRTFGISTPLTSTEAGTRSIRITYEATALALIDNDDEPVLPRPHHDAIAMGAAIRLLASQDLPTNELERRYTFRVAKMRRSAWEQAADYEGQITVIGRVPTLRSSNVGRVKRR